jgi:hypothetical protein
LISLKITVPQLELVGIPALDPLPELVMPMPEVVMPMPE